MNLIKQTIKYFLLGFLGFFIVSFFRFLTLSFIHGLIVALSYLVLFKISKHYNIQKGIEWLRVAVYVALFPYLFWFLLAFLIGADRVTKLHTEYFFLLGPIAIIVDILSFFLKNIPLGFRFLISTILWWLIPLIMGIHVNRGGKTNEEKQNVYKSVVFLLCILVSLTGAVFANPTGETHLHSNWSPDSPGFSPEWYCSYL